MIARAAEPPISALEALIALREATRAELDKPALEQGWTTCVLRALAALAPDGACVDPDVWAPRRGKGRAAKEHLWDLTISSWPTYDATPYAYPTYFEKAVGHGARLLLVAESEWGASSGRKKNAFAVLDDFCKLLSARAPLKVMVFGYFPTGSISTFDDLSTLIIDLIRASGDDAEYALFGVAWGKLAEHRDVRVKASHVSAVHRGP